jgi:hypothetical protein
MRIASFGVSPQAHRFSLLRATLAAVLVVSTTACGAGAHEGRQEGDEAGADARAVTSDSGADTSAATPDTGAATPDAARESSAPEGGHCPANFCACTCQDGGVGYRPQCDAVNCVSSDPCISGLDLDGGWQVCGL